MNNAFLEFCAKEPDLDRQGFSATYRKKRPAEHYAPFTDTDYESFLLCISYLSQLTPLKNYRKQCPGSYGLKHDVERWNKYHRRAPGDYVYVSNGILILAAIALQIPHKFRGDYYLNNPNVVLRLKGKSRFHEAYNPHFPVFDHAFTRYKETTMGAEPFHFFIKTALPNGNYNFLISDHEKHTELAEWLGHNGFGGDNSRSYLCFEATPAQATYFKLRWF